MRLGCAQHYSSTSTSVICSKCVQNCWPRKQADTPLMTTLKFFSFPQYTFRTALRMKCCTSHEWTQHQWTARDWVTDSYSDTCDDGLQKPSSSDWRKQTSQRDSESVCTFGPFLVYRLPKNNLWKKITEVKLADIAFSPRSHMDIAPLLADTPKPQQGHKVDKQGSFKSHSDALQGL